MGGTLFNLHSIPAHSQQVANNGCSARSGKLAAGEGRRCGVPLGRWPLLLRGIDGCGDDYD